MTYPIAFSLGWGCATLSITIGLALWEKWRPIHRSCIPKQQPSGILYCREHNGIKNQDDNGPCDMSFDQDTECDRWVELPVPPENVDSPDD